MQDLSSELRLTEPQRKKIWALSRELGWDQFRVHYFIDLKLGKQHVSGLTRAEARKTIDLMEGFVGRVPNRGYRERGLGVSEDGALQRYATPAELAKLRALGSRIGQGDDWLLRVAKGVFKKQVSGLANLRMHEAHLLINVVTEMVETKEQRLKQEEIFTG